MTTLADIYQSAENLINQFVRQEATAQGHYLTGAMEDSFKATIKGNEMDGFAVFYTQFVNEGVPAESASMKQFPFLYKYFLLRGLEDKEAKGAAAATIKTWMKEGMSTQASKFYSKTGARQQFVEAAFVGHNTELDDLMTGSFDFAIEEKYRQTKSETI